MVTHIAVSSKLRASRLGAFLTIAALFVLSWLLPGRYQFTPFWLPALAGLVMFGPIIAIHFVPQSDVTSRIERYTSIAAIVLIILGTISNLGHVVWMLMFHAGDVRPTPLFASALMIWAPNTLMFTLLYWELDAGGPDARANGERHYIDFDFPTYDAGDKAPPDWRPKFPDYLFIGFTTSAAFSPTEAMPLTARAKALMVVQGLVSLATISVVAARTINILQ